MSKKIQQWEYKLVTLKSNKRWFGLSQFITEEEVGNLLGALGALGWELVSERTAAMNLKYIFKRPR